MDTSLKLTFISGLKDIVLDELKEYKELHVTSESDNAVYLELPDTFKNILSLKSIASAYIATRDRKLNPRYINKHKSVLGNLIEAVLGENTKDFKTYRLRCAGSQSAEIIEIEKYIQDTYRLKKADESSMEIYISKINEDLWEISVRLSPRPLSVRNYKTSNIKGGLHPNIAYAINSFCNLHLIKSYLNIFSGSATLLIEAGIVNPNLKLIGLDNNKKTNSLAIQNIKKANLIKNIQIKTANINDTPDFGTFDVITSNLPFGMQISKGEDLNALYQTFINYCEKNLNQNGILAIYTTEDEILKHIINQSKFKIIKTVSITIPTSVNSYIHPKIFVCNLLY